MGHRESPLHRKSWDINWDVHFLTFSTFRRQSFFPGRMAAGWFLTSLAEARQRCPFHLFAYVVMPEHVHLVLQPLPDVPMRRVLWNLKHPVTVKSLQWVRTNAPDFLVRMTDRQPNGEVHMRFWERGGGYDRNVRTVDEMNEKIGYVHDNPVRRGLVGRPEDWEWSSAPEWILGRKGSVPLDWGALPHPS